MTITTTTQATMKITIKGGRIGYNRAVEAAYNSNMSNPTIRYSESKGFFVEPGTEPADDNVIWSHMCYYNANSGNRSAPSYINARAEIVDVINFVPATPKEHQQQLDAWDRTMEKRAGF